MSLDLRLLLWPLTPLSASFKHYPVLSAAVTTLFLTCWTELTVNTTANTGKRWGIAVGVAVPIGSAEGLERKLAFLCFFLKQTTCLTWIDRPFDPGSQGPPGQPDRVGKQRRRRRRRVGVQGLLSSSSFRLSQRKRKYAVLSSFLRGF